MKIKEAREWLSGERSLNEIISLNPVETYQVRRAEADAAMTQQAYWIAKAHQEGLLSKQAVMDDYPLNLNTFVRFKMTARGVAVAKEYWERYGGEFPNASFTVDKPDVEFREKFHELFRIFGGAHMRQDISGSPIYDLVIEPLK